MVQNILYIEKNHTYGNINLLPFCVYVIFIAFVLSVKGL